MKMINLILILNFVLFVKNEKVEIDSNSTDIIIKNDKLIYVTNENSEIISYNIDNNQENVINNYNIVKNKFLINLENEKFIIFGIASNNSFIYNIYEDMSRNHIPYKVGSLEVNFLTSAKYIIKLVTEDIYILSFIYSKNCYVYQLDLTQNNCKGGKKQITNSIDLNVNTFECDSFDGRNIFCVYSLTEYNLDNSIRSIQCFYSFFEINHGFLDKNEIKGNSEKPEAASLSKIEYKKEKKFIICFVKSNGSISNIYFQFFIQKGNDIFIDNLYKIGENIPAFMNRLIYENNNPIKIKIFKYTIYTFFEVTRYGDEKSSLLYKSSLDSGLVINEKINYDSFKGDQNILVNDKHRIIYKRNIDGKTKLDYHHFSVLCDDNKIYQFSATNQESGIEISEIMDSNISNDNYISFSLDLLTHLYIDNNRNLGGLSNEKKVNGIQVIKLKYNRNLLLSYNYYIFYKKTEGGNYISSSNFCLFKVINCYDTCVACNPNIEGTDDNHQCSSCIPNYYKYENENNQKGYYNCYKTDDPKVSEGVYFDNNDKCYYKCDISCIKCVDNNTCITCNNGYFFKEESVNGDSLNDKCYNSLPNHNYYLNTTSNLTYNNQIINFVYKKCYDTCYSCLGTGDELYNRCSKCIGGNISYPFDDTKCTDNKDECVLWKVDEYKNIKCIGQCDKFVIYEGINKNQCVDNCQSYFNPYVIQQTEPLLSYSCDSYKYCVTLNTCKSKKLNYDNMQCFPPLSGCVDIDIYVPPEISTDNPYDPTKINNRVKIIKLFEYKYLSYYNMSNNFIENQTSIYTIELKKELDSHKGEYLNGIDFITLSEYKDFRITLYPLNAEEYVYTNLFSINNLCYVNFTKFFQTINYKIIDENHIILIAIIEYKNISLPINSINYFILEYDEENNKPVRQIDIKGKSSSELFIEESYYIKNFDNIDIDDKFSSNLINTIQNLYYVDQDLFFYDKNNKLFNDICYVFASKEKTDMTIEDRINEFYYELNLCENNCNIINIFDINKNFRSLCQCKIKDNIKIDKDNYSFNVNKIFENNKANINALKCTKEVFKKTKIISNSLFWIFIIVLFVEVLLIFNIVFCGKTTIENMIKIKKVRIPKNLMKKKENNENKIAKKSNVINVFNENENIYQNIQLNNNLKNSINSNINDNDHKKKINISSSENHEVNPAVPPKRKIERKKSKENNNNNDINKKNNITTSECKVNSDNATTLFGEQQIHYDFDKNTSLEDIYDGDNKPKNNNYLLDEKNFIENNYLLFKRKKILETIQKVFKPSNDTDKNINKYLKTDFESKNDINRKLLLSVSDKYYRKEYNSMDNQKIKKINHINPHFTNISKIGNKNMKIISKYSEIHGDSEISRENYEISDLISEKAEKDKNSKNVHTNNDNENNMSENNTITNKIVDDNLSRNSYNNNEIENNVIITQNDENKKITRSKMNKKINRNLKSSINMSVNSSNKFLNSKSDRHFINDTDDIEDKKNKNKRKKENEDVIYNKSDILSSITDGINESLELNVEKNCFYFYLKYFIQREFFLVSFYNRYADIPYFIRITTFFIVMSFIFMINCLLLTNSDIHERYLYAKENNGISEGKYIFNHELSKVFLCTLISIIVKMVCVKLIYGKCLFKITYNIKEVLSPDNERNLNEDDYLELYKKRKKYIKKYWKKSLIFISIVIGLLLVFGYITVCYIGTFPNTFDGIILRFIFAIMFSFIFCAFICFIIVVLHHLGCLTCFNFLKKIY